MRTLTVRLNSSNQIEVRCGRESRCGECHYLELGATNAPGETNAATPAPEVLLPALQRLLREWLRILQSLEDNELVWLPFDFSDESTRWLAVQRTRDEAALVFGWAPVEGWAIDPGNLGDLPRNLDEFVPDEPLVVEICPFSRLLQDLKETLLELAAC